MKLSDIVEFYVDANSGLSLLPAAFFDLPDAPKTQKEWYVDFLSDLDAGKEITPDDLSYIEQNRAKNLQVRGLITVADGKYKITDVGREWKNEWINAYKNTIPYDVTFGSIGYYRGTK